MSHVVGEREGGRGAAAGRAGLAGGGGDRRGAGMANRTIT